MDINIPLIFTETIWDMKDGMNCLFCWRWPRLVDDEGKTWWKFSKNGHDVCALLSLVYTNYFVSSDPHHGIQFIPSDILSGISIWHSIWHVFWHFIWHIFWHSTWHIFWHSIWHIFWHSIWHIFWHSRHIFWHSVCHIFWHSVCHIFRHSVCHIFWYSICHIFWHSIWHSIWRIFWHSIWHIFRHSVCHIFWHSIWHIFWHSIWRIFWDSIWHSIWRSIWQSIWHICWHSLRRLRSGREHLAWILAVEVRQGTLGVDGRGWGPAGNTWRGFSRLRSGREHWAWMVAVEVRQGTLGVDTRSWGPAGNTWRGWSWLRSGREHLAWMVVVEVRRMRRSTRRRKAGGRRKSTNIKSNNPHLAGGEKTIEKQAPPETVVDDLSSLDTRYCVCGEVRRHQAATKTAHKNTARSCTNPGLLRAKRPETSISSLAPVGEEMGGSTNGDTIKIDGWCLCMFMAWNIPLRWND